MPERAKAMKPEDLTRLFVERANAGDAEGIAALYEPEAVMAYPPGEVTVGREAIREARAAAPDADQRRYRADLDAAA
jgi:ketosteroid isomerase-like protein